jgi:PAS domain S-box-containing protein
MKPAPRRYNLPSRQATLTILAVVLPAIASAISVRFSVFHRVPYALPLLVIAVIASLGGPLQSLLAVFVAVAARFLFLRIFGLDLSFNRLEIARIISILSVALVISLMTRTRRKAQAALEVAHDALRERTEDLIDSLHSSKCASWTMNPNNGQSARWYSGSYPIFGRPFSEVEQLPSLTPLLHPDDQKRMPALIERMKTATEPIFWEFRAPLPDGDIHWFEMRANRIPGPTPVWRGLTVDITERKLAESALLRSEKLAAMGRLASTVAHEINNPLEAVTNLLYLARTDPTLNSETASYLATAEHELARLGDITRLTLGFVRGTSTPRSLQVAAIADEVLAIFRHRLETRGVRIERIYHPDVFVQIPPHELRQILTNLVSNATDALVGPDARIAVRIQPASDNKALVIVEDNGCGISPEALPRIFEPFFTTKHDIGTGIGLWVTRELIESNGGHISAESGAFPDGLKTRFTIEFPAAAN